MVAARALIMFFVGILFSGTRLFIEWWKELDPDKRRVRLRQWSLSLFVAEVIACVVLALWFTKPATRQVDMLVVICLVYAWWRVNEIAYAFYNDALSPKKLSGLTNTDRIRMAMRSYFGLAVNFAIAYYFLPIDCLFKEQLGSFLEAFYFSGVTIATLGYGDILPSHGLSRLLALYEVFSGILILAIAIATYAGGATPPQASNMPQSQDDAGGRNT